VAAHQFDLAAKADAELPGGAALDGGHRTRNDKITERCVPQNVEGMRLSVYMLNGRTFCVTLVEHRAHTIRAGSD
jgi:hypothetical protein